MTACTDEKQKIPNNTVEKPTLNNPSNPSNPMPDIDSSIVAKISTPQNIITGNQVEFDSSASSSSLPIVSYKWELKNSSKIVLERQ